MILTPAASPKGCNASTACGLLLNTPIIPLPILCTVRYPTMGATNRSSQNLTESSSSFDHLSASCRRRFRSIISSSPSIIKQCNESAREEKIQ